MSDVAVSDLIQRYAVGKTHFYQVRLEAMKAAIGVEPFKRGGNKSFVSEEGVKFLDSLDIWMQENGSDVNRFLFARYGIGQDPQSSQMTSNDSEQSLTLAVMSQLATALDRLKPENRILNNFYDLEDACSKGWLIPTSKLSVLLGLKEVRGNRIERYGFVCERISKSGRESEWSINKSQRP